MWPHGFVKCSQNVDGDCRKFVIATVVEKGECEFVSVPFRACTSFNLVALLHVHSLFLQRLTKDQRVAIPNMRERRDAALLYGLLTINHMDASF